MKNWVLLFANTNLAKHTLLVRIELAKFLFFLIFGCCSSDTLSPVYYAIQSEYLSFKIAELLNEILKYGLDILYFPVVLDVTLDLRFTVLIEKHC